MNSLENWFCASRLWQNLTERRWLPWALEGSDLGEHVLEVGAVDDEAAVLPALHQPRTREMREVKRQRGPRQVELLADAPRRQARGPRLDQQAERFQPRVVGQRGERVDRLRRFHISRIMEM